MLLRSWAQATRASTQPVLLVSNWITLQTCKADSPPPSFFWGGVGGDEKVCTESGEDTSKLAAQFKRS